MHIKIPVYKAQQTSFVPFRVNTGIIQNNVSYPNDLKEARIMGELMVFEL